MALIDGMVIVSNRYWFQTILFCLNDVKTMRRETIDKKKLKDDWP